MRRFTSKSYVYENFDVIGIQRRFAASFPSKMLRNRPVFPSKEKSRDYSEYSYSSIGSIECALNVAMWSNTTGTFEVNYCIEQSRREYDNVQSTDFSVNLGTGLFQPQLNLFHSQGGVIVVGAGGAGGSSPAPPPNLGNLHFLGSESSLGKANSKRSLHVCVCVCVFFF